MPSFPLPRFLEREQERRDHIRKLTGVVQEADGDLQVERKRHAPTAMDALAARGIPICGPGSAGGVIRGTSPEGALMSKQPR